MHFAELRPQDCGPVTRVAELVSAAHPRPQRRLVDLRMPPRDPTRALPAYVAEGR